MQGTALGVAVGLGIGETVAPDIPDPAILQPSLRQNAGSDRSLSPADELPAAAAAPIPDRKVAAPTRAVAGPLALDDRPTTPATGEQPILLIEAGPLTPQSANFALPLASGETPPAFDAPASAGPPVPFVLPIDAGQAVPPIDAIGGLSADAPPFDTLLPHADNAEALLDVSTPGTAVSMDPIANPASQRAMVLALPDLGPRADTSVTDGAEQVSDAHAVPLIDKAGAFVLAGSQQVSLLQAAAELMATSPDQSPDQPASQAPGAAVDQGTDAQSTAGNGQAKEGDLLTLQTLSRGGLAVSGGYSSIEGPVGSIKLSRTNIGAPGRDITLSGRYSKVQALMELGASDTNFAGSGFAVAPTFFYSRSKAVGFDEEVNTSLFVQSARGINFYLGRPLKRGLRFAANYRFSDEDFLIRRKNALCDSSIHGSVFCNALGRSTSSVLSLALSLDRRDNPVNPKHGFQVRISQDIAGLGGTNRFVRYRAAGTFYHRLNDNIDLSAGLEGGYMNGYGGRDIPLFDRFYIGGNTMRGFDLRGLGPKVVPIAAAPGQATAIGGRAYYVGRVELSFHLSRDIGKFGASPSIFVDAGSVFGARRSELLPGESLIGNSATPRVAVGLGMSFNVAPGKLRFNIAQPVKRQEGDRSKIFSITFGTAF
ncbi:MAG: BamA/TamA family outer membrane protein [Sphingopyxis sp.]|uniref:BamA/TamA family outer membrane protein n=1 Tax=Sphingopyxis sp. TaxID=1908224 RepID=UPI001A5E8A81|nr:BamA/TamA family outer membrane protein [Sphingopyxis sp.]MBL9068958.1 BamA/TamA family outer membrane protein [Sphingopyxis sp.]